MSVKGLRSSSILTGTGLGASPMALSDATLATYQMIHMAHPPDRNPRTAGSTPGTVGAKGGGIGTRAVRPGGNPSSVTFRQPRGAVIARSAGQNIGER